MEEVIPQQGVKRSSSSILPSIRTNNSDTKKDPGWPITFRHLGKNGYELTLYAANQAARKKWLEFIDNAQQRLRARADFFNTTVILIFICYNDNVNYDNIVSSSRCSTESSLCQPTTTTG